VFVYLRQRHNLNNLAKGEVSIFVKKNKNFNPIGIMHHERTGDRTLYHTAGIRFLNIYVLAIYRVSTSDFGLFRNKLENIIHYLYKPKTVFIINIDYLTDSNRKQCPNLLLTFINFMFMQTLKITVLLPLIIFVLTTLESSYL
jgi:hypothetical protein